MKTKTLLLSAAALLAGGFISMQAQVYSQNVVGYANIPTPGSSTYMLAVPFVIGASNGANEVWPAPGGNPTLPDFSELLIWNGAGFDVYFSDSGSTSLWDDYTQTPINNSPLVPVGEGFFLIPSADTTNVFAGTVAVNVGTSNVTTLAGSSTVLVSPAVPYAGAITNGNLTTGVGGPNLWSPDGVAGLPDFSELLIWNGAGFDVYFSDSGSSSYWDDSTQTPIGTAPSISVGQGFFLIPSATFNWTVGL